MNHFMYAYGVRVLCGLVVSWFGSTNLNGSLKIFTITKSFLFLYILTIFTQLFWLLFRSPRERASELFSFPFFSLNFFLSMFVYMRILDLPPPFSVRFFVSFFVFNLTFFFKPCLLAFHFRWCTLTHYSFCWQRCAVVAVTVTVYNVSLNAALTHEEKSQCFVILFCCYLETPPQCR